MRKLLLLTLAMAVSGLFAGDLSGRRAPGFALPDLNLNYHDLYDHRGKVVVLDIMRTICPHCLAVSRNLERIKKKFGTQVAVISIVNPPDNQATVGKYLADNKFTTPMVFDCGQVSASYLKITPKNPSINIPHVFLIDEQGMIRNDFEYTDATANLMEGDGLMAEVEKMLKPGAAAPAKKAAK